MGEYVEQRWIGFETCPNGGGVHVLPVTISSSAPLVSLETPGNVTAAEPCPACIPTHPAETLPTEEGR